MKLRCYTSPWPLKPKLQVWPFTDGKFASQHLAAAFKGANLTHSLAGAARQMPLLHLLRSITVRYTKEVLELRQKIQWRTCQVRLAVLSVYKHNQCHCDFGT